MSYDNDNRGSIWPNKKREKDTHPHFTGSATVGGVEYWVSAWKRGENAAEGSPSLKFSFKPKEERQSTQEPRRAAPLRDDFVDDEIPFN